MKKISDIAKANKFAYIVAILLLTFTAYWNVQYNNFVNYDDVKYLIENETVNRGLSLSSITWAFTATYDANWFPLTWLSHMLDITLFGTNPFAHHLVNLLLHCSNVLLLLFILSTLTGRIFCSTAVALLFAVHPLHVESVAWVAERKDILSTLFFMLTLRSYIKYTLSNANTAYITVVLLYICGLASKPMLVTLPYVLLLIDYWPLARFESWDSKGYRFWLLVREKIPLILLSAVSSVLTYTVQRNGGSVNDRSFPPLVENVLHAVHNYSTYLYKIVYPVNLSVMYPYQHLLPTQLWIISFTIVIVLSFFAFILRKKKAYITAGWLWFVITLIPVIGIIRIGAHSIADRYTYIPSIGIFILVVWGVADVLQGKRYEKFIAGGLISVVGLLLVCLTWKQTTYWKDTITLFTHAITTTTDNWIAHGNLGSELIKYNRPKEALIHLEEAIRINPDHSDSYYNLGLALKTVGDIPSAIIALQTSIRVNPDYHKAYFVIGRLYFSQGDRQAADNILMTLKKLNPEMAQMLAQNYILMSQSLY